MCEAPRVADRDMNPTLTGRPGVSTYKPTNGPLAGSFRGPLAGAPASNLAVKPRGPRPPGQGAWGPQSLGHWLIGLFRTRREMILKILFKSTSWRFAICLRAGKPSACALRWCNAGKLTHPTFPLETFHAISAILSYAIASGKPANSLQRTSLLLHGSRLRACLGDTTPAIVCRPVVLSLKWLSGRFFPLSLLDGAARDRVVARQVSLVESPTRHMYQLSACYDEIWRDKIFVLFDVAL